MIGGNVFLGTHISEILSKSEHEIHKPKSTEVNWISRRGIEGLYDKEFDVVIHLLAIYGGLPFCMNNRVKMAVDNLEINANVYRYLANTKPKRVITMGSGCEYPGYKSGYLCEEDLGNGKLHRSVAHYGYSKLVQLETCQALHDQYGTEFEHVVLANMYGPGDIFDYERSHVVGALIKKFIDAQKKNVDVELLGTGEAVRDLIYVKDVAELIVKLIELPKSTNQPLNASTGIGSSVKELAEIIGKTINFSNNIVWGNPEDDGSLVKILDASKTKKILSWSPKTKLREGIEKTINWYLNDSKP